MRYNIVPMALIKAGYKVMTRLQQTVICDFDSNLVDLDLILVTSIQCRLAQGFDGTGTAYHQS